MPVDRTPVTSSNLRSVGYDQDEQILEIEFNSGGVYRYFGVPSNIYADLMNASSHGKYFHSNIKDVYEYKQVR
ncbi:KTSC domain-containing protein [Haloferax volcanii]|uniref:KTSC domain-containing protein n=1 Tax=Haloferax volcanii TaxID=2246 RepID=UPI001F4D2DF2|nr:KTSC domain-containing protein [Haloferax alexandrinus]